MRTTALRFCGPCAVMLLSFACPLFAGSLTVSWDLNTEADIAGYTVFYGTQSGVYTYSVDVGNQTSWIAQGLQDGLRYYFAVKAHDTQGLMSPFSAEVSDVVPGAATALQPSPVPQPPASTLQVQTVARHRPSRLADFDGDGQEDAFFYQPSSGEWAIARGGRWNSVLRSGTWATGWTVRTAELNGDGLADVLGFRAGSGEWFQAIQYGDGNFVYGAGTWPADGDRYIADLNGDGRDDVFVYDRQSGKWQEFLSDGVGGFVGGGGGTWSPGFNVYPTELNGDATVDIFVYKPDTGDWVFCVNDGSGAFRYYAGKWSAGWQAHVASFTGSPSEDLFVYDPTTGDWYRCLNRGQGRFDVSVRSSHVSHR